jgi:peptidoglycan/LPS O-acetylase OafA/YrhL
MSAETRNEALDGLRGLAALSVIFYHGILHHKILASTTLMVPIQTLSGTRDILTKFVLFVFNGSNAVVLFFVLSGYVLKLSLDRTADRPATLAILEFVIRRLFRLYPAIIGCMVAFYLIALLYWTTGLTGFPKINLVGAISNAALIDTHWLGPSLTIRIELLAIPFIIGFYYVIRFFGAAGAVMVAVYSLFAFDLPIVAFYAPDLYVCPAAFAAGVIAADRLARSAFTKGSDIAIWFIIAAFLFARIFTQFASVSGVIAEIVLAALLIILVSAISDSHPVRRFLTCGPISFLGRISYSLYLLNVLVLFVVWSFTDQTDIYKSNALEVGLLVGLVATIVAIPFAFLSEKYIERPGIAAGSFVSVLLRRRYPQTNPDGAAMADQVMRAEPTVDAVKSLELGTQS